MPSASGHPWGGGVVIRSEDGAIRCTKDSKLMVQNFNYSSDSWQEFFNYSGGEVDA